MADDLVKEWERLKLTEEEDKVFGGELEVETASSWEQLSLTLVGKLLTTRPYNVEAMKRMLIAIWRLNDNVSIRMIDTNLFVFQFYCDADKDRVIDGSPWSFSDHLLLLKDIQGDEQPSEVTFNQSPFWLCLADVPFGKRNASFAYEVGEDLGGFIEFDDSDPLGWEEFMRIKVMIDITKPLRRVIKVATGTAFKWVGIKYERMGDLCYYCGRLGNSDRDCMFQGATEDGKTMVYKYGPWLGASPHKRSSRLSFSEREKEKKMLDRLNTTHAPRVARHGGFNDPNAIRLEPPGVARKLSFSSPRSSRPTSPPCARESMLVAVKGMGSQLVLRPRELNAGNVVNLSPNVDVGVSLKKGMEVTEGHKKTSVGVDVVDAGKPQCGGMMPVVQSGKEVTSELIKEATITVDKGSFSVGTTGPKPRKWNKLKRGDTSTCSVDGVKEDVSARLSRKRACFDEDVCM